jgi:hypothetical protein
MPGSALRSLQQWAVHILPTRWTRTPASPAPTPAPAPATPSEAILHACRSIKAVAEGLDAYAEQSAHAGALAEALRAIAAPAKQRVRTKNAWASAHIASRCFAAVTKLCAPATQWRVPFAQWFEMDDAPEDTSSAYSSDADSVELAGSESADAARRPPRCAAMLRAPQVEPAQRAELNTGKLNTFGKGWCDAFLTDLNGINLAPVIAALNKKGKRARAGAVQSLLSGTVGSKAAWRSHQKHIGKLTDEVQQMQLRKALNMKVLAHLSSAGFNVVRDHMNDYIQTILSSIGAHISDGRQRPVPSLDRVIKECVAQCCDGIARLAAAFFWLVVATACKLLWTSRHDLRAGPQRDWSCAR